MTTLNNVNIGTETKPVESIVANSIKVDGKDVSTKEYVDTKAFTAESNAKSYVDTEKAKYLPLSGGALTGGLNVNAIGGNVNNSTELNLVASGSQSTGSAIYMGTNANTTRPNGITLQTGGTSYHTVDIKQDGSFTHDGREIKSMAFPSSTTVAVSLTFTSGSATYTAPANGYLTVNAKSTAATYACLNINNGAYISERQNVTSSGEYMCSTIPVLKGNVCDVFIGGSASFVNARFIYAQGEV